MLSDARLEETIEAMKKSQSRRPTLGFYPENLACIFFFFDFYNNVFTKINTTKICIQQCPDSNSVNCRGKQDMQKIKLVKC